MGIGSLSNVYQVALDQARVDLVAIALIGLSTIYMLVKSLVGLSNIDRVNMTLFAIGLPHLFNVNLAGVDNVSVTSFWTLVTPCDL